jgi:2-oxoglutarate ferredoxin oxidoreductase subunit alpha
MNSGQMLEDVIKAVGTQIPVQFYGRMGGVIPFPDEVLSEIKRISENPTSIDINPRASWMTRFSMSKI